MVMKTVSLRTEEGEMVCERCLVADSPWPRMRGLLGRRGLESGEGLLIKPTGSVHTFFMRFPIDVVFLSREGEVLKIARALPAWRMTGAQRAKAVLELAADEADRRGIRVGTRLDLSVLAGPGSGPAANHPPASA
jgi:uncharacterized protein